MEAWSKEVRSPPSPASAPDEGPMLSYDMENLTPDGRMKDLSGHENHGTITGTTDVAGKVGQARQFDGIGDGIDSPSLTRLSNGTFALWVRPDASQAPPSAGEFPSLIGWNLDPGLYIQPGSGRPYLQLVFPNLGIRAVVASTPLSPLVFRHVAATWKWDGLQTTMRIYVDGLEDATALVVNEALSNGGFAVKVAFSAQAFRGIEDEVLVFERALSAAEIAAIGPPPPNVGPILSYDMENRTSDGRMEDISGNGNHGTVMGTTDVTGRVGRARSFNGTDDVILVLDSLLLNPARLTVAGWVMATAWGEDGAPLLAKGNGGGGEEYALDFVGPERKQPRFFFWSGTLLVQLLSDTPLLIGAFYHIAVTFYGANLRLYINGTLDKTLATTTPIQANSHDLSIGSRQLASGAYDLNFDGTIDEVRIFSRALSSDEIASLASGTLLKSGGLPEGSVPPASTGFLLATQPRKAAEIDRQTAEAPAILCSDLCECSLLTELRSEDHPQLAGTQRVTSGGVPSCVQTRSVPAACPPKTVRICGRTRMSLGYSDG